MAANSNQISIGPECRRVRQLRIGAIGYYGFGNIGDEMLLSTLRAFLHPHRIIPIPIGLPGGTDTVKRLNAFDLVILGGGGLFQSSPPAPFGSFHLWGPLLNVPLGALGLGVRGLKPQHRSAVRQLLDQSEFFVVRDEQSKTILDHPKVQVAPDLTFYRPLRPRNRSVHSRETVCGVNLRPGLRNANQWVSAVRRLRVQTRGVPFSMHPEFGDRDILLDLDPFCPDVFPVEIFGSFNFLIATAFHAVVLAIQTATPVIAINYDPKVRRIMEVAGLSRYVLEWDEPERLEAAFREAQANRELICSTMEAYTRNAQETLQRQLERPRQVISELAGRLAVQAGVSDTIGNFDGRSQRFASPGSDEAAADGEASWRPTAGERNGRPPDQPNIGVIVEATGTTSEALKRTLDSIRNQTCPILRTVVIYGNEDEERLDGLVRQYPFMQLKAEGNKIARLIAALAQVDCEFVSYLSAGSAFAEEAVALLLRELQDSPKARGAHACYFLTREGTIERKVVLHRAQRPGIAQTMGPCFLVRRKWAEFLFSKSIRPGAKAAGLKLVYDQNPLFFRPSTEPEDLFFRGFIAFRRKDAVTGERLISQALANEHWNGEMVLTDDLAAWLARLARTTENGSDPRRFLEEVMNGLDGAHRRRLRKFMRRTAGHVLAAELFASHSLPPRKELLKKAFFLLTKDLRWLQNRGIWSLLLRGLLGRPKLTRERGIPRVSGEFVS